MNLQSATDQHLNSPFLYTPEKNFTHKELQSYSSNNWKSSFSNTKELVFLYCNNQLSSFSCYYYLLNQSHAIYLGDAKTPLELKEKAIETYEPSTVILPKEDTFNSKNYTAVSSPFDDLIIFKRKTSDLELNGSLKLLLSTSGSTGSTKMVRLSEKSVWANAQSIATYLNLSSQDKAITSMPMSYSYGLSIINSHIISGAQIVLNNEGLTSKVFWNTVKEHQPTYFSGVPQMYSILLSLGLQRLPIQSIQNFTQAGGKLANDLQQKMIDYCKTNNKHFHVMYGQTEATARISHVPSDMIDKKIGSIGIAIPGGRLSVSQQNENFGEIVYQGPNVMMGYALTKDDLALEDTLHQTLHTGDLGHQDSDGYFYITGRKNRIIKINGLRYSLDEVETQLAPLSPGIICCGEDNLLVIAGLDPQIEQLNTYLRKTLRLLDANFHILPLNEIPTNSNGKVSYSEILQLSRSKKHV